MVSIDSMREFVALAETLSFTKAAEATFTTQPTLSRHVSALEEEMGARLVRRSTVSVELTDAGMAVYSAFAEMTAEADRIAARYDRLKREIGAIAAGEGVSVRVASPYYWTGDYTELLETELERAGSTCSLEPVPCQPHEGYGMLVEGKCDALVMPASWLPGATGLVSAPFARLGNIVLMDRSNPLASRESLRPEDLAGSKLVQLDDERGIYRKLAESVLGNLEREGIHPFSVEYLNQVESLGAHLRGTGKLSLTSAGIEHMARSYLVYIPMDCPEWESDMCVICRADDDRPALSDLFEAAREIRTQGEVPRM